jgi:probable rRNA maturation factor
MNTGNNSGNTVEVRAENIEPPSWLPAVSEYALHVLQLLNVSGWEVSFLVCDAARIRQLNSDYRGIDDATDVLSFLPDNSAPDRTDPETTVYAGDIVISPEVVEAQSREFNTPYEEELRRVITHGLLHLYGYVHSTNDFSSEPMLILQEKIVKESKEKLF